MGTTYGRYELLRKIAAGGMAEIHLARLWGQGTFFRDVVIKRLFPHIAEHPPTLRMFEYEASLLAHLNHPSIPQVLDFGHADDTWYIAMEFVQGWNVADLWRLGARAGRAMPMAVSLGVVIQACEALHHAHEARDRADRHLGIVHRDVTPQNIMVTRDGVVKMMDFGVAKTEARAATEAGVVKGTFAYMAPEQVQARPLDRRADVFALGVILYELTTGSRLFRGSDMQVMTAVVEEEPAPPSSRVPDYPPDLEEIVLAALRKDPRSRIQSAADLALHLEHLAMRHGMMIGPRMLAHYIDEVVPHRRVLEEELALVPPQEQPEVAPRPTFEDVAEPETPPEDAVEASTPAAVVPEEDPGADEEPEPEAFLDVRDGELEEFEEEKPAFEAVSIEDEPDEDPLAELAAMDSRLDAAEKPESVLPAPLDGFGEEEEPQRPVVLLQPKRAPEPPEASGDDADYLAALERRLEQSGD